MSFLRRAACVVVLALAAGAPTALSLAPPAAASPKLRFGLKDDAWLLHGEGTLDERLATLERLDVQVVRFDLRWDRIATWRPKRPWDQHDSAYRWDGYDAVLRGLHRHGIEAIVGIWGTPLWANKGRAPNYAPTAGVRTAQFAHVAAKRYPWVRRWLIWNEPNQSRWLRPTRPSVYVSKLLNPAYAAIHKVIPKAEVAGGVSAPRGGVGGVSPVAWIYGMKKAKAHLDAYAHNPYPLVPTRETPLRGGCTSCYTLTMATLPRLLRLVRSRFGPVRIWLTEYGYQTRPPDPWLGVAPAKQARYLSEGLMRAYLAPRVDVLVNFLYRDEPDEGGFQSGLRWVDDRAKPALRAFVLPLAQRSRSGSRVTLWGMVRRPRTRRYRLQVYHHGWRSLTPLRRTGRNGVFGWSGRVARGSLVRLVAAGHAGAPLRVH